MSSSRPGLFGCCFMAFVGLPFLAGAADESPTPARPGENASPMVVFRAADKDRSGSVSWEELTAVRPAFTERQFKALDKNSNGLIERAEVPRPQRNNAQGGTADRNERERYVAKLLATHDRDKSGDVTLAEIQHDKPGFPASTFGALDRDKNGTLGAADLASTPSSRQSSKKKKTPPPAPASLRGKFQKADKNKDGKLSFDEARAVFPNMNQARFNQRDRNGDGFLSREDRQEQE